MTHVVLPRSLLPRPDRDALIKKAKQALSAYRADGILLQDLQWRPKQKKAAGGNHCGLIFEKFRVKKRSKGNMASPRWGRSYREILVNFKLNLVGDAGQTETSFESTEGRAAKGGCR